MPSMKIYKNKSEILLLSDRYETPLHNNSSERDTSDIVKKRYTSVGPLEAILIAFAETHLREPEENVPKARGWLPGLPQRWAVGG